MKKKIPFNDHWKFTKDKSQDKHSWEDICLPHTWNAVDGCDGKRPYYRGECWYAKEFCPPALLEDERVFLEIPALSLCGSVYVNGSKTACHEGGFSSFVTDITDALRPLSVNEIQISADNSEHSNIYPQMADFTFYGGLYRGANLLILPKVHFDLSFYGSEGIQVSSQIREKDKSALLHLESRIAHPSEDYTIRYLITDAQDMAVAEIWRPSTEPAAEVMLSDPHLWQGVDDPYLYHIHAALVYRNDVIDEVSCRHGIRSFFVDPEKGFFLNGKPMMLRGVSRHQDRLSLGNALTLKEHREDAELIREIGANTVRLAHYQHSRDFYDLCDEYGFIVWAEIPYISCQSNDPAAHENCRQQMLELIYQNYNHPSICFWGISNEITICGEKPKLVENHRDLNSLIKQADPTRLTAIAHVSMLSSDSPLHGITDVESYNHYFGWYGGSYENNEKWLDHFHKTHPGICLGLSEYGAEGIITYQPDTPKCRDYSEAYQAIYHEHMVRILMDRPYLFATHVWNMFDFGCAARDEGGVAGRNNKGLVTMDRKIKKDAFYLYKAYWSKEPFVHLCGRRYSRRCGEAARIKVYSNAPQVTLYVNGELFSTQTGCRIFCFENIPLNGNFTFLTAVSGKCTDTLTLEKVPVKPSVYTLPAEADDMEGAANWFDRVEVIASDAPIEFSETHFSVKDQIKDILKNDAAFQILQGASASLSGMKLKKSMMSMFTDQTVEGLFDMMQSMGGGNQKIPDNGLQILNAELGKLSK